MALNLCRKGQNLGKIFRNENCRLYVVINISGLSVEST